MGISVGDLVATLQLDDKFSEAFHGMADGAEKVGGLLEESLGGIPAIAETAFAAIAAGAAVIGGLTAAIIALGERGSAVNDVAEAFDQLNEEIGGKGPAALAALRSGTQGLLSDFDLMKSANKALSAGWQGTTDDMHTVGETAVILAKRLGLEGGVAEAYNQIMDALTTGRTRGLTNTLGVFVEMKGASADLKTQLASLNEELTTSADVAAKQAAAMEAFRAIVKTSGPPIKDFDDQIVSAKVNVHNFVDALSVAVNNSPAINTALQAMNDALAQAFGPDQAQTIKTLSGYIDAFAIGLVKGAGYVVQAVGLILKIYDEWKIFNDAVVLSNDEVAVGILQLAADYALAAEVVSGFQKPVVAVSTAIAAQLKTQVALMADHATATAMDVKAMQAHETTLDGWKTNLDGLADKMTKATASEIAHTTAAHASRDASDAASKSDAEWAQKLADFAKNTDVLGREIVNAVDAGEDMTSILDQFGKKAHDATLEAAALGVPLGKLPEIVRQIDDQFRDQTIQNAIAQNNIALQAFQTKLLAVQATAADKRLETWFKDNAQAAQDWQAVADVAMATFGSDIDQAIAKAQQLHDQLANKLRADLAAGAISATDFALAMRVLDAALNQAKADAPFNAWMSALSELSSDFQQLSQVAGSSLSPVIRDIGTAVSSTEQFLKGVKNIKTAGDDAAKSFAGYVGAITGAIQSGISVNSMLGGGGGGVHGALAGAAGGALTGAEIGSIIPGVGTAVGAVIGGIGGAIKGLFGGSAGRDAVQQYVDSQGGFTKLHQSLDTLGQAGEQLWVNLTQGVGSNNPDQAKAAIDAVTQALTNRTQGLTNASTGLGAALKVTSDATSAFADDQSKLNAILANATPDQPLSAADAEQVKAINADLATQQQIIDATSIKTQGAASGIAGSIVAIVDANVQAGESYIDAVRNATPMITSLQQQLDKAGYSGGAAFDFIKRQADLASDAVAGPALTAVEGYTAAVKGLSQAGLLTQDEFAGLESQIGSTYQALVKQGKNGKDVMAAMQGDLQAAWEAEQNFGFKADDVTQALIDQGVQAGMIGEKQKPSTDQMIDALNHIATTLDLIAQGMVGPHGIAAAASTAAGQIQGSFDGITGPTIDINYRDNRPPDVGGGDGSQPPTMDAPIQAVTSPGLVRVNPGDIVGMPRLTPGFGGEGPSVAFHVHLENVTVKGGDAQGARDTAEEIVEHIVTSGALRTRLVNGAVKPGLQAQGLL